MSNRKLYGGISAALALIGCSPATEQPAVADQAISVGHASQAGTSEREREAREAGDRRLFALAASGGGDPVAEARRAAVAGDFRFVGVSLLVPGIFPAAIGVQCRPSVVSQAKRLVNAVFAASDVIGTPEQMQAERVSAERFGRFGRRYNAALLADPRYPYRDFCRPAPPGLQERAFDTAVPHEYGFRDLQPTDRPIDLGEAARRGTLAALDRLIAAHRSDLDKPDILDMTPLGWAIAYRRKAAAETLLRAGSNPAGAGPLSAPTSPMQIARAMRWRSMIERLLAKVPASRDARLADPPRVAEGSWPALKAGLDAAARPYLPRLAGHAVAAASLTVDASGKARQCAIDRSSGDAELDQALCRAALRHGRWDAALGAFGEPIAATFPLSVRLDGTR